METMPTGADTDLAHAKDSIGMPINEMLEYSMKN